MGKTKITVIDDSTPAEKPKKKVVPKQKERVKLDADSVVVPSDNEESLANASNSDDLNKLRDASSTNAQNQNDKPEEQVKKADKKQKPSKKTKLRSKKYREALEKVDRNKNYPLEEAINLAKETSYSKYDGSLEAHINTTVKNLRGLVSLPFASGKKLAILAFGPSTNPAQTQELEELGAAIGNEDSIDAISEGKINFDVLVTTPEWMPKLARVAKFLGPRGLMPNPKNGTITSDLKKAVTELQSGKTEYKTEKLAPVIHLGLGKVSQPVPELSSNVKTLLNVVGKTKIKKVTLSPTLGPGIKVDPLTAF
ncbi:50S ribosomal protein L1 [Candidatus Daviesbacteria bacterium]|nr:50S ribosomal protein L1 [Candidatus Daviesbacteria bacterium]